MKVGFIGLGAMGLPMARNVHRAGFALFGYDIRPEPLGVIRSWGATPCASADQLARECDVIISMLPDSDSVERAALGKGGVLESARTGLIFAEMSTTSLDTLRKVHKALSAAGCSVLDAPVSGVPDLAEKAELTIMVGGEEQTIEKCLPLMRAIGNKIVRTGGVGSARLAKFVNNMLVTINMLSSMEILAWARRAGADDEKLVEVVRNSMSFSRVFDYHAQSLATRREGYLQQHIWLHKDLKLLLEEAEAMGSALPMAAQAKQLLHSARNMAAGAETIGALLSYFETVAGGAAKVTKEMK